LDFQGLVPAQFDVVGLPAGEMGRLYDRKMAAQRSPARAIYDAVKLAAENGQCPLCGHRQVMTLDHYLPKSTFPALAVNPVNLVPACRDCNSAKLASTSETLHPYYDAIEGVRWLAASVVEGAPAAARFFVEPSADWPRSLAARVNSHFQIFGLADLYTAQAAVQLSGMRRRMEGLHQEGGAVLVRSHLAQDADSWRGHKVNAWQTAFYDALRQSNWYCSGGFASG
jgi:hypothetical protein